MPRFLGRDYYNDDFIARRELNARASLIVPRRFEEECEKDEAVSFSDVFRSYKDDLGNFLRNEECDDGNVTNCGLDVSHEKCSGVEQLQWVIKWKEFDGNYIEIVPSSNPESESSIFGSQPDSVSEACVVEEFSPVPLQWTREDKGCLEEPVHMVQFKLLTTSLPNLMKWSTRDLEPSGNDLASAAALQNGEDISEEALFGKSDLHLELSAEPGPEVPAVPSSTEIFSNMDKFEPHHFTQAKAEALLYPVTNVDTAASSQQQSQDLQHPVLEARATCTEQGSLQAFPGLLSAVDMETADNWSVKDLIKRQQTEEKGVEKLFVSLTTADTPSDFVRLNEQGTEQEETVTTKPASTELEPPVLLLAATPPAVYEGRMTDALMEPWSPHALTDDSPLLNRQATNKLEAKLRYREACFGNIQAVKFLEPQLHDHEEQSEKASYPLAEAIHLASTLDCKATVAQLELNLTWDLTLPKSYRLSHLCPESFGTAPASLTQPQKWEVSLELEAVEAIVERELEKKAVQVTQREKTAERSSVSQSENLQDGRRSLRNNSFYDDRPEVAYYEDGIKIENSLAGVCTMSAEDVSELPDNVTKSRTLTSTHTLQSFKRTTCEKANHGSQVFVQDFSGSDVSLKKHETAQNSTPKSSSRSTSFPFRETFQGHKLDVLETPSVSANKNVDGKETKNDSFSARTALTASDRDVDMMCRDHEPRTAVSDSSQGAGSKSEYSVPSGFDLHFDEEDLDLGSDSFDDLTSPENKNKTNDKSAAVCESVAFDPVDNFLMMRDARAAGSKMQDLVRGHSVVKPVEKTQQGSAGKAPYPGVITPMTVRPKEAGANQQRFLTVSLSGPYQSALQEICSQAQPYMDCLRTRGIVPADSTFLGLKPDYTRFLLKDSATRLETCTAGVASQGADSQDAVYQSVAVVHTLRLAAHLLEHCCLEAAIVHLGAMQDKRPVLTGALEGLRKALFQCQFSAQQSRQLHPKVAAVCREMLQHQQSAPSPRKVLVVVRREEPTLVKTLQSAVSVDGTAVHIMATQDGHHGWPSGSECVLTWDQGAAGSLVPVSTLVLEFEADDPQSSLHNACLTHNVSYVGLAVQEAQTTTTEKRMTSADKGVTVVGSQHLIQFQQLLQLLETRHNIIVVRRDYASLGHLHYPDVVVNVHTGAILLPIQQLREEGGLERVTERLAAVGLQLSTVWILLHGMAGSGSGRTMFDKDGVKKIVQLQALMANLSTAAKGFVANYKVLLCRNAADVGLYIAHLTTTRGTATVENCPLPPVEMSKEEKFLLGIPCLNPFSCQVLLSRACVGQVLTMTLDQLRSLAPELPDSCLQNLHRVVSMDRGLHLRPYVTEAQSVSQTCCDSSDSGLHLPPDSTSLCRGQNEEKADLSVPLESQTCPPVTDWCHPQTESQTSHNQDGEKSRFMSPEATLPKVPLSLSRSLHYTDQPTPFLQPVQKAESVGEVSYAQRDPDYPRFTSDKYGRQEAYHTSSGFEENQYSFHADPIEGARKVHNDWTHREGDYGRGSQEYTPVDYHSTRNSMACPAALPVPVFPKDQRQKPPCSDLSSGLGEGETFSSFKLSSSHPVRNELRSQSDTISSSCLNISKFPESVTSFTKPAYVSAQMGQQYGYPDQQRMVDARSSVHAVGHPLCLRTNTLHDPVQNSFDFASSRTFEGKSSSAEQMMATSGSHPVDYYRTSPKWNDGNFLPSVHQGDARFVDERELYQRQKEERNYNHVPRSETLPLEYPLSPPPWQTKTSQPWKPHTFSFDPGHRVAGSHILPSTEQSVLMSHPEESQRSPTALAKDSIYARDSGNMSELGDMSAYSAHLRHLASDCETSLRGSDCRNSATESLFTFYRDEDTRHPPPGVAVPPRAQPSFCEDLAATTRRLLQGISPGLPLIGGHYHKPRTPVHRISVGLAQPLRREGANSQESGQAVKTEQMSWPDAPKPFSQQTLSPPLDMDCSASPGNGHHISDTKLRKWSSHLQSKKKLGCDSRSSVFSEEEVCPSAEKRRAMEKGQRLTYQAVPGAGGQTKLAFL